MYVFFLLSKACVGPPWTKICSLKKLDQHLKGTKKMQTPGRHVCRCCIMTPTPKNAEDFFQQQTPSHCLETLLFMTDLVSQRESFIASSHI